ncbi:hypothetical protein JCM10213_001294 [Rhodosporidiobolus nylandii]
MSYPWATGQPSLAQLPQQAALSTLLLQPTSSTLPSLPPAPPAADLHGARIKLTLDKVKLELEAVKRALDDVKVLGEAIEGIREETRLIKLPADAELEKRILDAVRQLLASQFEPLAAKLDACSSSVLAAIATSEKDTRAALSSAQAATKDASAKASEVEKKLKKELKDGLKGVGEKGERRVKALEKQLKELKDATDEQAQDVALWEEEVDGLENRVEALENGMKRAQELSAVPLAFSPAAEKATSALVPSPPLPLRQPALHASTAAATVVSPASVAPPLRSVDPSSSLSADSPPRRLSRPHLGETPTALSGTHSLPTPALLSHMNPTPADLASRTTSAPEFSSRPSALVGSTFIARGSLRSEGTASKRRLIEQTSSPNEQEDTREVPHMVNPVEAAREAGVLVPLDGNVRARSHEDAAGRKRRRLISQSRTPRGTQEEEVATVDGEGSSGGGGGPLQGQGEEEDEPEPDTQ